METLCKSQPVDSISQPRTCPLAGDFSGIFNDQF